MPRHRRHNPSIHLPHLNWPSLLFAFVLWFLLIFTIIMIDPDLIKNIGLPGSYLPFFILVLGALAFTFDFFLKKFSRSLLYSFGLTTCLFLQLHHLLNPLNLILILSLIIVLEFLFGFLHPKSRSQKVNSKHPQTQPDTPSSP